MKIKTMISAVCLLALSPALQAQEETISVPVTANEVRIELPGKYRKMWPDEFDSYKRQYTLSNGQTLTINSVFNSMYARIDGEMPHKIVAAADNVFVALDRQLKMEIKLIGEDDAKGWVTMMVPAQTLSSGEVIPEKIVHFAVR